MPLLKAQKAIRCLPQRFTHLQWAAVHRDAACHGWGTRASPRTMHHVMGGTTCAYSADTRPCSPTLRSEARRGPEHILLGGGCSVALRHYQTHPMILSHYIHRRELSAHHCTQIMITRPALLARQYDPMLLNSGMCLSHIEVQNCFQSVAQKLDSGDTMTSILRADGDSWRV